jgi:hypothetical protein
LDDRDILAHLVERIDAAPVVEEPFPHLVVAGLLPDAAYRRLLDDWPPDDVFDRNRAMQRNDARLYGEMVELPEHLRATWRRVVGWTTAANRRIARKFAPYARLKYEPFLGKAWKEATNAMPRIVGEAQLAYYTGAFHLAPHVDHPKLVTNSFLYCSERAEDEPELGTVLYGSRGFSAPDNFLRLTPDLVERLLWRAKVIAYAANICLAYLNTPRSFHGVDPIDLGTRRRRLLMFGTSLREKDTVRVFGAPFAAKL